MPFVGVLRSSFDFDFPPTDGSRAKRHLLRKRSFSDPQLNGTASLEEYKQLFAKSIATLTGGGEDQGGHGRVYQAPEALREDSGAGAHDHVAGVANGAGPGGAAQGVRGGAARGILPHRPEVLWKFAQRDRDAIREELFAEHWQYFLQAMKRYGWQWLRAAKDEVARWPLIIDPDPNLTAGQLVSRARISKRRYGTRLFGVDYLQKMRGLTKPEFRHVETSEEAVKLASLAKKDHLAVVALSSLTDKGGRASDAAPTLGDLRQSGDIQYEAGTVIIVHRPVDENGHISEAGQMIIARQRGGSTGQFGVRFNDRLMFEAGGLKPEPAMQR